MLLRLIRTNYRLLLSFPSIRILDRTQPGINFLYPCHALREAKRVIAGLEMRIDMEIKSIRLSNRTGTDRVSTVCEVSEILLTPRRSLLARKP
jgi:hypothetical protein